MIVAAGLLLLAAGAAAGAELGEIVFQTDFEHEQALQAWGAAQNSSVQLDTGYQDSRALSVDRPASEGVGSRSVRAALPLDKLRGARLKIEAMVRAENVVEPPQPWNGIKCMLHVVSPEGNQWLQQNSVFGSFDWKPVRFLADVPQDATAAWLILGLEQTTGRVWFDNVKVTVVRLRRSAAAPPPAGPVYNGHELPRLRGAMIGSRVDEDDLRVLGEQWGANHVRWQLIWGGFPRSPADRGDLQAYDQWLESELVRLDRLAPLCERLGIKVLIDLHTPPGGRNDASQCRMFHEARFQESFVQVWEKIARRYKDSHAVWGYDLVNEPVEGIVAEGLLEWRELAIKTAQRVRQIDPDHAIIIEPAPWGSPAALEYFEPIPVPKIVYSVHMYQPHAFTHQGVHGNPVGLTYPGVVEGKQWDKEQLRRALQPVVDFQRDYGVHIYLGEFSAIRWAPDDSAHRYLRDLIDIFEDNGWDWAYHAFREWDGWSVEHGPDQEDHRPSETPTDREQLLRHWFGKNEKGR